MRNGGLPNHWENTLMIIHAHDCPSYRAPVYHAGLAPPFEALDAKGPREKLPDTWTDAPPPVPANGFRIPPKKATAADPYQKAYVRDLDGAVMIEIAGLGCYVSEAWAVKHRYISASDCARAKEARKEARATRKEARAANKKRGAQRQRRMKGEVV